MPTDLTSTLIVLARLLLGGAFVVFAIRNFKNIPRLTTGIAARGIPQPNTAAWIGVILQLAAGVLTAIGPGWLGALGGVFGIIFVYVAAWLFHHFWAFPAAERTPHVNAWVMNTALAGGFLMVIALTL